MNISKMQTKCLEACVKNLEHAKVHRSGGLLTGEQKALDDMKVELENRADIEYCKAHDC